MIRKELGSDHSDHGIVAVRPLVGLATGDRP